jgi:hypothetical protein
MARAILGTLPWCAQECDEFGKERLVRGDGDVDRGDVKYISRTDRFSYRAALRIFIRSP